MSGRYSPMSGEGARTVGGRWNPPDSFPTLYLGSSTETAEAEVSRAFATQGRSLRDAVGLVIYEYRIELIAVLDLTASDALERTGLTREIVRGADRDACQAVGDAAHFVGLEGIRAPSAAGVGETIAIFIDKQRPESVIVPGTPMPWQPD